MARLSGLGKGLGALIPTEQGEAEGTNGSTPQLTELPIRSIQPNPNQPRVHFDEESLTELAASIREIGVLQPVLVRPSGPDEYQLIAGERRWRAARRAGLATVPAIIRPTDDVTSVEQALVENLHRQDLTALEEAAAFQQLIEDFKLTHEQVATRVGKSRSAVTNTLRLMQLPGSIQHLLADGRLSAGHAKALLGTPDRALQERLARQAVAEGWSVRAVEDAVRVPLAEDAGGDQPVDDAQQRGAKSTPTLRPPGLLELEELLADHLDTRVSVTMAGKKGRVTVDFADLDDLERIYRRMTEPVDRD
ncbi:MAG: ParB/RepB/Spo0J family partition protein [Acidimicrobiia bacterium]